MRARGGVADGAAGEAAAGQRLRRRGRLSRGYGGRGAAPRGVAAALRRYDSLQSSAHLHGLRRIDVRDVHCCHAGEVSQAARRASSGSDDHFTGLLLHCFKYHMASATRRSGGLTSACCRTDFDARGDAIMWVTPGATSGHGSGPALQAAIGKLQELQFDLAHLLRLRKREAEYQVRSCNLISCHTVTQTFVCCDVSHVQPNYVTIARGFLCAVGGVCAGWLAVCAPPRRAP